MIIDIHFFQFLESYCFANRANEQFDKCTIREFMLAFMFFIYFFLSV